MSTITLMMIKPLYSFNHFSVVLLFYKNQLKKMWPALYVTVASCDLVGGISGKFIKLFYT